MIGVQFIRLALLFGLALSGFNLNTTPSKNVAHLKDVQLSPSQLLSYQVTRKYNEFQNRYGQNTLGEYGLETLFADDFTKAANGTILVNGRSHLMNQLGGAKHFSGPWTIEVIGIYPFADDSHRCLNVYDLHSSKGGSYHVRATMTVNSIGLITSIDEVYYRKSQ